MIPPNIQYIGETTSTNDVARAHIEANPNDIRAFAVVAESQTAGKGYGGREWHSPKGNLYMTLAVPQNDARYLNPAVVPVLSLLVGLACRRAMLQVLPDTAAVEHLTVKWPNDVICQRKKVGGTLVESVSGYFFFGIGMNVDVAPEVTDLGKTPTTLNALAAELQLPAVTPRALAAAIWENFFDMAGDPALTQAAVVADFDALMCRTLGLRRRLANGADRETWTPVSINPDGSLLAKNIGGQQITITDPQLYL